MVRAWVGWESTRVLCAQACCALLLLLAASVAHAQSVYQCSDGRNGVAFQATPCGGLARQKVIEVQAQPLIDPNAVTPVPLAAPSARNSMRHSRARAPSHRFGRMARAPSSYECRAADGEVFYRHARCPHSIRGDGIARFGADQADPDHGVLHARRGRRGARSAWSAVTVTGRKLPREEACRQINATAASDRDGHARDEQVSVYEHNLRRDPCDGS